MSKKFSYRSFLDGDEKSINLLYKLVTKRQRSNKQFIWQWLKSPAGPGDIWLIFDKSKNLLIGHHGIMPIRFTNKKKNLIFGKTENTMVLPEYRENLLYPRYEKKFKNFYEKKYHALFSTFGPKSAMRVRGILGYKNNFFWKSYILGSSNFFNSNLSILNLVLKKLLSSKKKKDIIKLRGFLTSKQASKNSFFDYFWDFARMNHTVAPRRNKEDLHWRFWSNPNKRFFTLIQENSKSKGYAIISVKDNIAYLADYAVMNPTGKNYSILFNSLLYYLKLNNIFLLRVWTTSDQALSSLNKYLYSKDVFINKIYKKIFISNVKFMPRHITNLGFQQNVDEKWHITNIITEGI